MYKAREGLQAKERRAQWNRGGDYFILMSATRQGHVQGGQRRLQAKEKRAQWNRGGYCFNLIPLMRQVHVQGKGGLQAKETRAQLNRGGDYSILVSAARQGEVTRHRQQQDKKQLRAKAERAQWNRRADYLILTAAIRQGKLQDIVRSFGATGNKGGRELSSRAPCQAPSGPTKSRSGAIVQIPRLFSQQR